MATEREQFYRGLAREQVRVGMEATGCFRWFQRLLTELGQELWVGDGARIRAASAHKAKTDKRDAELLRQMLIEQRFPRIWIPSSEQRDARQLVLHRHRLVQMRTRIKNQVQALAMNEGLQRKHRLWSAEGRQELMQLELSPWGAQRREDLLALLQQMNARIELGNNPGPIARGASLTEQPHAPDVPAGLPSSLLERRPDIREAEAQLMAANAQIGVAKAAYFPQISLTANSGYQSSALTSLFTGPAGLWNFGGSLIQPIFAGGRIRSGVKFSEARQQETLLMYQQTIQQAFRGVSDALVEYHKDREFTQYQQQLTLSAQDAARLSEMRYRGGAASYLEVLTNETNYFAGELGLAQAQLNELLGLVRIYRNLGGGWQE